MSRTFAAVLLVLAARASAVVTSPVLDVETVRDPHSFAFGAVGSPVALDDGTMFFQATTIEAGTELWKTDGRFESATQVADLAPGGLSSMIAPRFLVTVDGNVLYYVARASTAEPWTLWRIGPGDPSPTPVISMVSGDVSPRVIAGKLLFGVDDASQNVHIVAVDLATGGQVDLLARSSVFISARLGDRVFLIAGDQLWITDGTAGGTLRLSSSIKSGPIVLGDRALFGACDDDAGCEPWITDGTPDGTRTMVDLDPGPTDSNPRFGTSVDGAVYFSARVGGVPGAYRTDGTPAGTVAVTGLPPALAPQWIGACGHHAFALVFTDDTGTEPWIIDAGGARALADLSAGTRSTYPALQCVDGTAYLFDAAGARLWVSDATEERVSSWSGDATAAAPTQIDGIRAIGHRLVLRGSDEYGEQLWLLDPESNRLTRLSAFASRSRSALTAPMPFLGVTPNGAVFAVQATEQPPVLWRTDGSAAGTIPLAAVEARSAVDIRGGVFFVGCAPETGCEPWFTDGTPAGTHAVGELIDGSEDAAIDQLVSFGGKACFAATVAGVGRELWCSDGTPEGTALVADLTPGADSSNPYALTVIDRDLFFVACNPAAGCEPYRWVGPGSVPELILDAVPGPASSPIDVMVALGAKALYGNCRPMPSLAVSDGTGSATQTLVVLNDGDGCVQNLVTVGDAAFFTVETASGTDLWVTDGTAAGTRRVSGLGETGYRLGLFAGRTRVFGTIDAKTIVTLDPTAPHDPTPIVDPDQFGPNVVFSALAVVADRFYFTVQGASLLDDGLWSVEASGGPPRFEASAAASGRPVVTSNRLFFGGSDYVHGREPWAVPVCDPADADRDGDGVCDSVDTCIDVADAVDTDEDGVGDACDECTPSTFFTVERAAIRIRRNATRRTAQRFVLHADVAIKGPPVTPAEGIRLRLATDDGAVAGGLDAFGTWERRHDVWRYRQKPRRGSAVTARWLETFSSSEGLTTRWRIRIAGSFVGSSPAQLGVLLGIGTRLGRCSEIRVAPRFRH